MNRSNYALLAALYLLTADSRLWNQVKDCVQHRQMPPGNSHAQGDCSGTFCGMPLCKINTFYKKRTFSKRECSFLGLERFDDFFCHGFDHCHSKLNGSLKIIVRTDAVMGMNITDGNTTITGIPSMEVLIIAPLFPPPSRTEDWMAR